jgi:hypothetical protein
VDEAWRRAFHRYRRPVFLVEIRAPAGDALQFFDWRTMPVEVVVDLAFVVDVTVVMRVLPLLGKIAAGGFGVHGGSFNE